MTQAELIRASGISEATVRPLMQGEPGNYRNVTLAKISRALGWRRRW